MESRIQDLETRLTFQEDLLAKLDDALSIQQRQLIDITQRLEVVTEQLRLFLREVPPSEGERPPHY
ncbi:MAG: SlyX family protein [Gammaproteobacteria bacterium TMED1]|nr:MAG: SlyX family protein [Gammaproteobacteria bacterium TMED1]